MAKESLLEIPYVPWKRHQGHPDLLLAGEGLNAPLWGLLVTENQLILMEFNVF